MDVWRVFHSAVVPLSLFRDACTVNFFASVVLAVRSIFPFHAALEVNSTKVRVIVFFFSLGGGGGVL